jgi:predicted nuclease of predicted toxin-antitoxin system
VKFLVDAQLPVRLARLLSAAGHDSIHTSGLPDGNRSTDQQIAEIADSEDRVVVTKDRDFRDSHLLAGSPRRLLVVATGNISNDELLAIIGGNLVAIVAALEDGRFVEIGPDTLVIHRDID